MLDLDFASFSDQFVSLFGFVTALGFIPVFLLSCTCFPFLLICLSILRQAIGLPTAPPNMLIVVLAVFMTAIIMRPVLEVLWSDAVLPFIESKTSLGDALLAGWKPLSAFMLQRLDPTVMENLQSIQLSGDGERADFHEAFLVIPAFILSEISAAFQVGFILFLPFLIIDLAVAAVLMSMGMMMVPPAVISLPFKLAFFVLVDGWSLVVAGLVTGYS